MNIFQIIRTKLTKKKPQKDNTIELWRTIDRTIIKIFAQYHTVLLTQPITDIAYTVWGCHPQQKLSTEQKEIHQLIVTLINDIFALDSFSKMPKDLKYTVEFILRGLIIYNISYTVEAARTKLLNYQTTKENEANTSSQSTFEWLNDFNDLSGKSRFRRPRRDDSS
jgi:hypothetical protein